MSIHEVSMSPDKRYRYWLEARLTNEAGPVCMFLMLNPSTANAVKSDRTISACKRFAEDWGHGTLSVCNLFALRSPDPKILKESGDPVGPENDEWILRSARDADVILCAWGNQGGLLGRDGQVRQMLDREGLSGRMRCLGLTKSGQPRHPLRMKADTLPMPLLN